MEKSQSSTPPVFVPPSSSMSRSKRPSRYSIAEEWEDRYTSKGLRLPRESHHLALSLSPKLRDMKIKTILDVGCGEGLLIKTLAVHGFIVAGTEISQELINGPLNGYTVYPCPINEMHKIFGDGEYDFVFSVDVLDHVSNKDSITAAKEMVRIGEVGFCAIVNGDRENQTLMESPSLWTKIFEDILGNKVDVKYGKCGVTMITGWKEDD